MGSRPHLPQLTKLTTIVINEMDRYWFLCYKLMEWQWLLVPPNTFQRLLRLLSFHCAWIEAIPAALDAHCAIYTSDENTFRWFSWICAHIHMAGCEYWLIPGIWYWYKETWSQQTDWSLQCPCVWWSCLIYMLVFCSLPVCMGLWWDSHFKPQPLHSQSAWMGWVMSKLTCLVYWDLSLEECVTNLHTARADDWWDGFFCGGWL